MPRAQFVNTRRGINVSAAFPTPKRMTELRFWLKSVKAHIKEVPKNIAESEGMADRTLTEDGWFVATSDADEKWIRFNLENRFGETAQIVIDRKYNNMGR